MGNTDGCQKSSLIRQKGYGTVTFLTFILMLGVGGYVGAKLVPSYIDYRVIVHAMDEAVKTESIQSYRSKQIVNLIKDILAQSTAASDIDLDKVTSVVMRDGRKVVKLNYEVAVPLVRNASALLHFTHEAAIEPISSVIATGKRALISAN